MESFLTGVLAGYGIAIPVGAIAVLIVDVGIRHGFRRAFFAGAGAATADLVYAGLAVIGGATLTTIITGWDDQLQALSGLVLIVIAVTGLAGMRKPRAMPAEVANSGRALAGTYGKFLGLTVINPTTVIYFAAVVVGLGVASDLGGGEGVLFAIGAFLASLSWQTLLAAAGAGARHRLTERARRIALITGHGLILAFALVILFG